MSENKTVTITKDIFEKLTDQLFKCNYAIRKLDEKSDRFSHLIRDNNKVIDDALKMVNKK